MDIFERFDSLNKELEENVSIPIGELIKYKDCDFRIILGMSILSYYENNTRVINVEDLCKILIDFCNSINISISNFNKKIKTILKKKSNEFEVKIITNEVLNKNDFYYVMKFDEKVKIPIGIAKIMFKSLSSNAIKLFCILLYFSEKNEELTDISISESILCELIGLSFNSEKVIKKHIEELIEAKLINRKLIRKEFDEIINENKTIMNKFIYEYQILNKEKFEINNKNNNKINEFDFTEKRKRYKNSNRKSLEYVKWRIQVLNRDNYTCKICGATKDDAVLQVHHIKRYKDYEELRTDINNGITLCYECHKKTYKKEEIFEDLFMSLI